MNTKKNVLYKAANDKYQNFEIRDGGKAGFYLFVYDNGNPRCIRDHLQDTLEIAKRQAFEDYGVPESAWQQAE